LPVPLQAIRATGARPSVRHVHAATADGSIAAVFEVHRGPGLTADGRFVLDLRTTDPSVDGRRITCVIALPGGDSVSFSGVVIAGSEPTIRGVVIEERLREPDEPLALAGGLPLEKVRLVID
jgi:hypothetical protein